jgi:BTB/POZ domain
VTGISNSNRLFNNKDDSDVEIRCGNRAIAAHKSILSHHSETLRTAFSSTGFVESSRGVYTISAKHMRPAIVEDVVRCAVGWRIRVRLNRKTRSGFKIKFWQIVEKIQKDAGEPKSALNSTGIFIICSEICKKNFIKSKKLNRDGQIFNRNVSIYRIRN